MAFDKYKDGAWQEPEDTVRRYANGAWDECESAKRYVSGAWEEIWVAMQYMAQLNNTLPSGVIAGYITGASIDKGWGIWYFESGSTGSGSVTYYLEGDFVSPTISFDYDGFFSYTNGSGEKVYASVGKVDLYERLTDGVEIYTTLLSSIKVTDGYKSYSSGSYNTVNRIGIRFTFSNYGLSSSLSPQYLFNIYNILIDGKQCLPSSDCIS